VTSVGDFDYEALNPETKATYAGGAFKGNRHTGSLEADKLAATSFTWRCD
jgi:hypothetical protein